MEAIGKRSWWSRGLPGSWAGKGAGDPPAEESKRVEQASEWDGLAIGSAPSPGGSEDGLAGLEDEFDWSMPSEPSRTDQWASMHGEVSRRLDEAGRKAAPGIDDVGVATACLERMLAAGLTLDAIAEAMIVIEDSGVRAAWAQVEEAKRAAAEAQMEKGTPAAQADARA